MRIGTIPLIKDSRGIQVCLVSTTKNPALYTFPKGAMEAGESQNDTALRELLEEAGMHGKLISTKNSIFLPSDLDTTKDIIYYFVEVTRIDSMWEEKHTRKRIQVYLDELENTPLNDKAIFVVNQLRKMGIFQTKISTKTTLKKFLKNCLPKIDRKKAGKAK
ncbi:NUDIX domain-containing protein [Curvivirga sp.]|uniref:NUDIX domain-containing protein n=1 Tax=Curvivirga sp. TaxID=2856848 RepID=UPI003B5933F9